jgi:biopolymer transport protein ExbD
MIGSIGDEAADRPISDINVTPLVDVMLVLLIIFIVTAPLLTHAVRIDLPQGRTQPRDERPVHVTLAIDEAGRFYWDNALLARDALSERLREAAAREPQPEVHVRADRGTRYELLAGVLAEAQRRGVKRIGFVTLPEERR